MKKFILMLAITLCSFSAFSHSYWSFFLTCTAHYTVVFVDQHGNYLRSETYTASADDCTEAMRRARNGAEVFILN